MLTEDHLGYLYSEGESECETPERFLQSFQSPLSGALLNLSMQISPVLF